MAIADLQRGKLETALSMRTQDLMAIANGAPSKYGVDSLTAVMALQIKGPAEKAARAQQAAQQPKEPSVKDKVISEASDMGGITNLPAENIMTPKAMASGGIVAFQEGGRVPTEAEVQAAYRAWIDSKGPWYLPTPKGSEDTVRRKEAEYTRLMQAFQAGRPVEGLPNLAAPPSPTTGPAPAAPTADRGMTVTPVAAPAPAAPAPAAPAAPAIRTPGVSMGGADAAMAKLRAAYKPIQEYDPMKAVQEFNPAGYERYLPKTPEAIAAQYAPGEAKLREALPQSLEEANKRLADRYAGLEAMFAAREERAKEAVGEAEKVKGETLGIGLMQLASELVSKPLARIDTGAAFQTFKEANTAFKQAKKDYRDSLDKIGEARELQKIGQAEKADAMYREGVTGLLDYQLKRDTAVNAADAAYKSGLYNLADKSARSEIDRLNKTADLAGKEVEFAFKKLDINKDLAVAQTYASARGAGASGRSPLEDKAQDNAKAAVDQWMKSPQGQLALAKDKDGSVLRAKQDEFYRQELAKLQGQAVPSGGGAGRAGAFTVERLPAK